MSMTLATAWVRRGFAAEFPTKYEVDEAELGRIEKLARLQLEDAQDDLDRAQNGDEGRDDESESEDGGAMTGGTTNVGNGLKSDTTTTGDDDLKDYHLSDYDDEVDEQGEKFAMFGNVRSLAYHGAGEDDPYLVLPEGGNESDDEREELQILATDNLILAAKVEDEVPHLEVFVYEDDEDNIYVHHDIMLPSIPLCLEWFDVPVGKDAGKSTQGNFVAVGMMSPGIEIWNLDVIDGMYPAAILGQQPDGETVAEATSDKKNKKKKKKPKANDQYHVDAVLALAANRQHRNLLASGSADKTVKLWDVSTGKCVKSYSMHDGKVGALDWHPKQSTVLLSGSDDKTVIATDMRAPDAVAPRWRVGADVEKVRWDVHNPDFFYVTTEAGMVYYFDARSPPSSTTEPSKPVWILQAHDAAVSAFDINPTVPGFLATGSEDKKVKIWNVQDNKPSIVVARNFEVGRVFATQFGPDPEVAFRLSVAGSKGQVQVWDTSTNSGVRNAFATRFKMPEGPASERLISAGAGGEEEESSEGEDGEGGEGWESMDEK